MILLKGNMAPSLGKELLTGHLPLESPLVICSSSAWYEAESMGAGLYSTSSFLAGRVVSRLATTRALPASEQELKRIGEKNAIITLYNGLFSRVVMGTDFLTNKRLYEPFIFLN
jgi:hypothetical protein